MLKVLHHKHHGVRITSQYTEMAAYRVVVWADTLLLNAIWCNWSGQLFVSSGQEDTDDDEWCFTDWDGSLYLASFAQSPNLAARLSIYLSIYTLCLNRTGPLRLILIWHNFTTLQHLLIISGRVRPYSISSWQNKTFLNWLRTSCVVSITTVAALHIGPANFWADFEQRIIDRAKVSSKTIVGLCQGRKTALRTLVVTFEVSTLHTVPIETQLLSVQCYAMHGQNINLPVCVCVCVCVWVCVCVCVRHTFCQLAYRSDSSTDSYSW